MNNKRLLLISNSTLYGGGYLEHAATEINDFLGEIGRVLFVPYALFDRDAYASKARASFQAMGYELDSVHDAADQSHAIEAAAAVFIGGGNTFRLLKALYDNELMESIRRRVGAGMPYIGSSAGTNVAAPSIKTTNDMPIVQPPSFFALGLVNFQICPHYRDPVPDSTHMGETQEERLVQFLEENDTTVVALREGAMLRAQNGATTLKGTTGGRIFRKGHNAVEVLPGTTLDSLIGDNGCN